MTSLHEITWIDKWQIFLKLFCQKMAREIQTIINLPLINLFNYWYALLINNISLVLYWVHLTNEIKNETSETTVRNVFCLSGKMFLSFRGVFRNLSRGGLHFLSFQWGASAPVGVWKPPEINRFHSSRGGLSPHSLPWIRLCFLCQINK